MHRKRRKFKSDDDDDYNDDDDKNEDDYEMTLVHLVVLMIFLSFFKTYALKRKIQCFQYCNCTIE